MLQLLAFLFSALILIVGCIAKFTNNSKLMKVVIKQKKDESEEDFMKRSLKNVLILAVAFLVLGLVFSI